ncbi:MAG TPA: trigger factor [Alphaproteobacteria bacterium]|nr:trigger factor [Alphaproteobacteria bacterium]
MQITETNANGLKREFKVVIPADKLQDQVDSRLKELGERIKMPGFRPGKVPLQLLKQRYEKSVMGEVLEKSVQEGSSQLMTEHNLRPAGQPKVEIVKFETGQDLEFSVALEVIPEITPVDFKTISLQRTVVDVPEAEIEESLGRLAKRQRKAEPAADDYAAQSGDVAVIDFVGRVGGKEFEGGKAEDFHLELGSGMFIPGFEDQLIGLKKGDKRVVKVTFPAEYGNKELAGKDAEFDVTGKEIRTHQDTPLDDEMAKAMGVDDLATLRKRVREQIERDYGMAARSRLKRVLLDMLADKHDFTLPESLVEAEFDAIWRQIEADIKAERLDDEDKGKSEDQLKSEYRDIAKRRVKLGLLLSEVGRANNIQVPNEDLTRAVINEARRYPGQEKQVIDYYQKSPEALNQLRAPIYEDKVIDFILEMAQVSERRATPEEFRKEGEEAA